MKINPQIPDSIEEVDYELSLDHNPVSDFSSKAFISQSINERVDIYTNPMYLNTLFGD